MIKNYYEILNVRYYSSQTEIKSSFKKLALFWHPDKNGNPIALQKMQEINEAYAILSDEVKRTVYNKIYLELFANKIEKVETVNNSYTIDNDNSFDFETKEDFVRKKYEKEVNDLTNWIKNIKFSIADFDKFLEKSLSKADKPIENFVYYLPYVVGIIFFILTIILVIISSE